MALSLTHATVAVGTDAGNGEIAKEQWNEAHSVSGVLDVANGGTGQATASAALAALDSYLFVTSAAGTTTLTVDSPRNIYVTGTLTQTIQLPDVTTLALGWTFNIINTSTSTVTVQSSGGNAFSQTIVAATNASFVCTAITGTTTASWGMRFEGGAGRTGTGGIVVYNAAPTFTASTTIQGNTITADAPVLNMTQTWNNAAVTFTGLKLNVTDTTSASASLLADLQVGGSSAFSITKGARAQFSSANLKLGAADAAAPVAQTLGVQSVVAGTTNTAGANFTIAGSQGTGTGAGGSIIFQVAPAGSTGSAQNALATALTIDSTKKATFAGNINMPSAFVIQANGTGVIDYNSTVASYMWFANTNTRMNEAGGFEVGTSSARKFLITNFSSAKIINIASDWIVAWASGTTVAGNGDTGLARSAANILAVTNGSTGGGALQLTEMTAPAAGAANTVRIYAVDNGAGKTQLMAIFPSGAAQQIAIEP